MSWGAFCLFCFVLLTPARLRALCLWQRRYHLWHFLLFGERSFHIFYICIWQRRNRLTFSTFHGKIHSPIFCFCLWIKSKVVPAKILQWRWFFSSYLILCFHYISILHYLLLSKLFGQAYYHIFTRHSALIWLRHHSLMVSRPQPEKPKILSTKYIFTKNLTFSMAYLSYRTFQNIISK